ncbi:hypothetical protein M9H77_16736 [Catharanthus roseus]|uniref:Uncharacterized protein n=1 Tax=Catharanthus roseus TaxID=4058 RepID=A0ACC0B2M2_CATRO|nr:hypothetical protein M9H77_16736 [Catharanthus roseus]
MALTEEFVENKQKQESAKKKKREKKKASHRINRHVSSISNKTRLVFPTPRFRALIRSGNSSILFWTKTTFIFKCHITKSNLPSNLTVIWKDGSRTEQPDTLKTPSKKQQPSHLGRLMRIGLFTSPTCLASWSRQKLILLDCEAQSCSSQGLKNMG